MERIFGITIHRLREASQFLILAGLTLWSFSLPFAQAQHTRFTSIFLISFLVGFLIFLRSDGFSLYRFPYKDALKTLPWVTIGLLPLMHGLDGDSGKEFVARLPFLFLPFAFLYWQRIVRFQPFPWMAPAFLAGLLICLGVVFSFGPVYVYDAVRTLEDSAQEGIFLINRPYFGFVLGLVAPIALSSQGTWLKMPAWVQVLVVLVTCGLQWFMLTKLSLLAFALAITAGILLLLKRSPVGLFLGIGLILGVSIFSGIQFFQSPVWQEIRQKNGISYHHLPKEYSNSINNRLILWKASVSLIQEGKIPIWGQNPEALQSALDTEVARQNTYLASRHMNCHNQPLYMGLKYGIPGFLVWIWFWAGLFVQSWKSPGKWPFALTLYIWLCSLTENYLDREMGIQLYLLVFILVWANLKSSKVPVRF
jgi:hypothetical protein